MISLFKMIEKIAQETAARIEPSEIYLKRRTTIKKIINEKSSDTGSRKSKIPLDVATPLPPLNPRKGLNMLPDNIKKL